MLTSGASRKISCPGKVFVVGEYACLAGHAALLLPCEPAFSLSYAYPVEPNASNTLEMFAERSPAGLLLRAHLETALCLKLDWHDPYDSPIGVGSSSAQFVLTYQALTHAQGRAFDDEPRKMLEAYWSAVGSSQGLKPSGLDVLLQAFGKPCQASNEPFSIQELSAAPLRNGTLEFLLAYSGRKTKTHDHLKELAARGFPASFSSGLGRLADLVKQAVRAWDVEDLPLLGRVMNDYQDALKKMEIAPRGFAETVESLQKIPGVLGCKGAGAQGGDCVLVLAKRADRNSIEKKFAELGFVLTSARV